MVEKKPAGLNQPVYFKDVLTSDWEPGCVLFRRQSFAFVSTGEEKLKLIRLDSNWRDVLNKKQ